MDRSKWEYKKLGEVCTIIGRIGFRGYTKADFVNNPEEGAITLSPSNIVKGEMDFSNCSYITWQKYEESPEIKIYPGDILLVKTASVGKTALVKSLPHEATINPQFVVLKNIVINNHYLSYCLKSNKAQDYILSMAKGAVAQTVTQRNLAEMQLAVPSIEDQQRIVTELDCLNEMIAVKQEQLKEFDKLAQSIFYDMFGDPVANEKGWDIIELGTKCDVTSFKRVLIEEVVDSGVPFIRGTELMALSKATKGEKIDFSLFITPEHYERVKAISGVPKVGDLLIPSINSDGNIWILDTDEPRYYKDGRVLWVHVNHDAFSSEALKYIMHILLKKTYSLMATGATFAELKLFVLRELKVPLPPLTLQQQFAEKISAIEAQKELVKQSIAETQALLDYTMDKYFG